MNKFTNELLSPTVTLDTVEELVATGQLGLLEKMVESTASGTVIFDDDSLQMALATLNSMADQQ